VLAEEGKALPLRRSTSATLSSTSRCTTRAPASGPPTPSTTASSSPSCRPRSASSAARARGAASQSSTRSCTSSAASLACSRARAAALCSGSSLRTHVARPGVVRLGHVVQERGDYNGQQVPAVDDAGVPCSAHEPARCVAKEKRRYNNQPDTPPPIAVQQVGEPR
jgi:hypothetical protein